MLNSACTSPGEAEGGTGKPPNKKKQQEAQKGGNPRPTTNTRPPIKKKGARDSHTTAKPHTQFTRGGPPPLPGNTKGDTHGPPERTPEDQPAQPGDTQPKAAAHHNHRTTEGPEERTPRTRRTHPTRIVAGHRQKEKNRRNPNERGRGDGDQGAQDALDPSQEWRGLPRDPTPNARTTNDGQKRRGKAETRVQTHAP